MDGAGKTVGRDEVVVNIPAAAPSAAAAQADGGWQEQRVGMDVGACYQKQGPAGAATLSWASLVVTARDTKGHEKQILKGVDGFVQPTQMLAIMGPSGLGHTAKQSGEIRVNGHKSKLSYGKAAYVTQDEVLIGTLTVKETIWFAAKLRLPQGMAHAEKQRIVDDVISEMGLEGAADTYIGNWHLRGVSGGQRRRVSIAAELVTSPKLLFLDEPTSGLDSAAAFYVIAAVRRLAEHCRTVISVIHQPSSEVFALFDQLCLLSDGQVVYFGQADKAVDFFAAAGLPVPAMRNPADHFLHTINRDFSESEEVETNIATLVKAYQQSTVSASVKQAVQQLHSSPGEKYVVPDTQPNWLYQTSVLTWRTFLNNMRNIGVFWMRLAMYILLTLMVAFVYFQLGDSWKDVYSRAALLFFVVAFLTFMSIAAFPAFIEDMKVFIRERLNGYYGVSVFTVANTLASLPFIFLISVVSTVCVYWIASLRSGGGYVWYFILDLFMSLVVVESLMMAIAPLVPHFLMGIAAGAGIMGMYMIVCGFFQPLNSMPKPIFRYPLSYISYHTWAFTGFMRNEFLGTSGWECPCAVQPGGCGGPCSVDGGAVLAYYDIMDFPKWAAFALLIAMAVLYRFAFFLTLKYKELKRK